jgi:hypothetical protein
MFAEPLTTAKYAKHARIRPGALTACSIVIKNSHIDYIKNFPDRFREGSVFLRRC